MRRIFLAAIVCLGIMFYAGTGAWAADRKLPVIQGKKTVASVNGEYITLDEFERAHATSVQERNAAGKRTDKEAGKEDVSEVLQRLINARLMVQEGRRMGLDELPEIKNQVDVYARVTLREFMMERPLKGVQRVDKAKVEKLYQDAIREWKISSLLFKKEDDAKSMLEDLKNGKDFSALSQQRIATGEAQSGEKGQYLKVRDVNPEIAKVVSIIKPGAVSPVIAIKSGFVLIRLEAVRSLDNAEEKEQARRQALSDARLKALKDYNSALIKKYVKLRKNVLNGIDYEAKEPSFQELLKDKRVIADIQGEAPITVGDLSQQLRQEFYHGVDKAIESKKLNAKKGSVFDDMLYKRVFRKEALRLGLDKTERYAYRVREYEDSIIFGAFIQKAVIPDVKLKEEELKTYYDQHLGDFTLPEMLRIASLVFTGRDDAERALEKLGKGTDFKWLLENAERQVDKNSEGLLVFDGGMVMTSELPEGLQKAVAGAKSGDFRLYASPEGRFYVLFLQTVVPSKTRPYEEAREEIAKKIFDDNLKKTMDDWTGKLRAVSDIKVYLQ